MRKNKLSKFIERLFVLLLCANAYYFWQKETFNKQSKKKGLNMNASTFPLIAKGQQQPTHNRTDQCNYQYGKGGILIVADKAAQKSYKSAIRSMQCYGKKHGYSVMVEGVDNLPRECLWIQDFMFKRHCILLKKLESFDWLAMFDGDVGIVNSEKCLESLMTDQADIVHEERFHNGEIQAGNYIVKNTSYAKQYIREWINYDKELTSGFHNQDNGALHIHVLKNVAGNNTEIISKCYQMWKNSNDLNTYDEYVGCVMGFVSNPEHTKANHEKIRIIRRGHGFVRDLWVTEGNAISNVDFFVHALKENVGFYDVSRESEDQCGTPFYQPLFWPSLNISREKMAQVMVISDTNSFQNRPKSVLKNSLIGHCWPDCKEYW